MEYRVSTFNEFCIKYLDRLYTEGLPDDCQCTGYRKLKEMVKNQIEPASFEEIERWEKYPTPEELASVPDIKYLRFLHPLLRPIVIEKWDYIKNLPSELDGEGEDEIFDEKIDALFIELDTFVTDYDPYEYGLPIFNENALENMRGIVKKYVKEMK